MRVLRLATPPLLVVMLFLLVKGMIVGRDDAYAHERLLEQQNDLMHKHRWVKQEQIAVDALWSEAQKVFKEAKALQSTGVKVKEVVKVQTETKTIPLPPDLSQLEINAEVASVKVEDADGTQSVKVAVNVNLADPASDWHATVALEAPPEKVHFMVPLPSKEEVKVASDGRYHVGKAWVCGPGVMASIQAWPNADAGVGLGFACIYGAGLVKVQ